MNEINIILKEHTDISRKDLLHLLDMVLCNYDNNCPKSIDLLRNDIDRWCSNDRPYFARLTDNPIIQEIAKSENFFDLIHKVESYRYYTENLMVEGLRVIGTDIILEEYSEEIPEFGPYGGSGPYYHII